MTTEEKRARQRAYEREWRRKNPDRRRVIERRYYAKNREAMVAKQRTYRLKAKYGITDAEYGTLLESQGGVCAICGRECPTGRQLAVDHDHGTGAVRGLLCAACNRALGNLQDDLAVLESAMSYIRRSRAPA